MSTVTEGTQPAGETTAAGRIVRAQMPVRLGESNPPRFCTVAGR